MSTDPGWNMIQLYGFPRGQRQILYFIFTDRSADIRSRWIKYRPPPLTSIDVLTAPS